MVPKSSLKFCILVSSFVGPLQTITDEEVAEKQMDRGDFTVPLHISLDVYREALLIFYGKVSVYAKAMGVPLTQMWRDWIA